MDYTNFLNSLQEAYKVRNEYKSLTQIQLIGLLKLFLEKDIQREGK